MVPCKNTFKTVLKFRNVKSLLPKVDDLQNELSHFDILAFTETWFSDQINDNKILFSSFKGTRGTRSS